MEVKWSTPAKLGLKEVVEYLENKWSEKQIVQLNLDIQDAINQIQKYNDIGISSEKQSRIRKVYPNKYTYLVYTINLKKGLIEIIHFQSTKQKPI